MKCRQIKAYWIVIRFVFLMVIAAFLAGCFGGGDGSDSHTIVYQVDYPTQIEVAVGVSSLLTLKVSQVNGDANAGSTYSIMVPTDSSYLVQGAASCSAIPIGEPCQLYVSLKDAAKTERAKSLKFSVVMPSGHKGPYDVKLEKKNLLLNVQQRSVFPTDVTNKITVTNLSNNKFFFDKAEFLSAGTVVPDIINHNSCITTLDAGKTCDLTIQSPNEVSGRVRFDLNADAVIQSVAFSKVVVSGKETVNIPANTAKGNVYPFTYTFTNTSTILPATSVNFINSFPSGEGITVDPASSCKGLIELAKSATCIWKGTYNPVNVGDILEVSSTLQYNEGADVSLSSQSAVSEVVVTGTKTVDIPANTAKGNVYPFTYTFTNTSTILPATSVNFINSFPSGEGITVDPASSCKGLIELAKSATCIWKGTYNPVNVGDILAVSSTLQYNEGADVTLSGQSTVSEVVVTGTKTLDIPADTAKGNVYPFTYTFTNTSTILPATDMNFTHSFPVSDGFMLNNSSCLTLANNELTANTTCTLTGTFTPTTTGNKTASATLHYNEGADVSLSSQSTVSEVVVTGTKTVDIPADAAKGDVYPFTYTFTNTSTILPATDVNFTYSFPVSDGFMLNNSSCLTLANNELTANTTCTLTGTFTPTTTGNKTASATLHYNEGADVSLISQSEVPEVAVTGAKTLDIPANTAKGNVYPFTYTFTNTSTILPATDMSFTHSFPVPDGFMLNNTSSCLTLANNELTANTTCTLTGTFTPTTTGNKTASATLHYKEGADVSLISQSEVSEVAVTGAKTLDIPANTAKGNVYPFTYTFTNTSTILPATDMNFTHSFPVPDGFILNDNSLCLTLANDELPANTPCTLTGTFTPTTTGNKTASATLHYNEGADVSLSSQSTVSEVAVTGTKTLDIPADTAKGDVYPFTYTFTNTSTILPATDVNFTYSFPVSDGFMLNDNSSCLTLLANNELPANTPCTLTGTFTPTTSGNKTASATLHYNEGADVTLSSNSNTLIATTPINTGPNTPTEFGWKWPVPRFVEATGADGNPCADAVYDKLTGLMWVKDGSTGGSRNWADAKTYVRDEVRTCGYSDWRLPNKNVLSSLVNTSDETSPASWLNSNGFTGIGRTSSYWSSNVYSLSGGSAWVVYMGNGNVLNYNQTSDRSVLPVRGPS